MPEGEKKSDMSRCRCSSSWCCRQYDGSGTSLAFKADLPHDLIVRELGKTLQSYLAGEG